MHRDDLQLDLLVSQAIPAAAAPAANFGRRSPAGAELEPDAVDRPVVKGSCIQLVLDLPGQLVSDDLKTAQRCVGVEVLRITGR
jgi:hypothetical protein